MKVTQIVVDGKSIIVSSWKKFLIEVLNELIKNNHFHDIEKEENLYEKLCPNKRKKNPIPLRTPTSLANGIQIETNCNTQELLKKIKAVADCCNLEIDFIAYKK